MFASKDYDDVFERNEFFNRFIKKVLLFNDKIIVIMRGSKGAENELAINNDELYAKRILEKFEKKEISENNFENKNGSLDNMGSHFCENDKILKEKEAKLDNFVHQPPLGGGLGIRTPGGFHLGSFQDCCIRPLYQPSIVLRVILYSNF